ncbi:MAG: hypothetical protein D6778_03570 [Nitrospirae bacterium]|nr:MAG: hypothetical protein D6778_03570 [Nitrospirota bacterium]
MVYLEGYQTSDLRFPVSVQTRFYLGENTVRDSRFLMVQLSPAYRDRTGVFMFGPDCLWERR